MNDPKGSIWRKWDLHIHTPASYHWSGEKYNNTQTQAQRDRLTREVIEAINNSDVDAFGIMDYWTFDGYLEIRRYLKNNPDLACNKAIFPGMELRIESPVDYRLNIHVLLSDKLTEQQLSDFKSKLKILSTKRPLSDEAITHAGRELYRDAPDSAKKHGVSNSSPIDESVLFQLGSKTIEITRESFESAVRSLPERSCLVILPYDTSDGLENLDWEEHPFADIYFMRLADMFEARSPKNIDLFLNIETEKNKDYINNFLLAMGGKPKPAVSGSDAHKVSAYGKYPSGRITWIKADLTFDGLCQVLVEPRGRTFIGERPPDLMRVANNATKYLRSIQITRSSNFDLKDELWFDNELQLNHGLVAVIGNKGNGKSALADILGLLCDSHRQDFFSFLSVSKFRGVRVNKAKHFQATVVWESGLGVTKNLGDVCLEDGGKIRYIPQLFFEKICNETDIKEESEFDGELKKVIFSHVPEYERLQCNTLDELLQYKTEGIDALLADLRSQLVIINTRIAHVEDQLAEEYINDLKRNLSKKQQELQSIDGLQPEPIEEPVANSMLADELKALRLSVTRLSDDTEQLNIRRGEVANQLALIDKVVSHINTFKNQATRLDNDISGYLDTLGMNLAQLVVLSVKTQPLENLKQQLLQEQQILGLNITEKQKESLELASKIEQPQKSADNAVQAYQRYLTEHSTWETTRASIIGSPSDSDTMQYYEAKITEVSHVLPLQLQRYQEDRIEVVKKIYRAIMNKAIVYREAYAPVQNFIDEHPLIKETYRLGFEVSVNVNPNFPGRFLDKIKQSVSGSFQGRENAERTMKEILSPYNFDDENNVISFLGELIESLRTNRNNKDKPSNIKSQLKNISIVELYNFLFGLDYLMPSYSLTLDKKTLPQLSPGERGILLLIFYLLIDKHDCPLIIDQPEENLDNQSIYELLVPCIERAKKKRQIILVTHNANLAVVCDADQVIYARIDKQNSHRVIYESGSIENPYINKLLINILEGTLPAFTKRQQMYQEKVEDFRKKYS